MSKFQDRFCFGIKRESSFSTISVQRERPDRIPISLQREKTLNPERNVYSIHRDKSFYGERVNLSFPRERVFQPTQLRKTVKFQKLCGWKTPDIADGVVEWVKIQLQINGKKDRKLKITTEDSVFRHVPKRRCPGIQDADGFEKDSLHSHFFISNEKAQEQKSTKKRRNSALKPIIRNDNDLSTIDQTRRLLRSRSKDDMGVIIPTKKIDDYLDKYAPPKRSKSVLSADDNTWKIPGNSSQLKRLLKCAKLYHSKDNVICDDDDDKYDDEGYGSKTSSADDKLNRGEFGGWDVPFLDIDHEFKGFGQARKPAKFSYTHQSSKTQLYGDSEDEGLKDIDTERTEDSLSTIKYYKTGYQDNTPDYITRLLDRTYSQMGSNCDHSDLLKIREIRSTRLTLRKICIQDAKEVKSAHSEPINSSIACKNQKEFYDQQKTLVRSTSSLQTDRTQYPLYCTSPELKFTPNPQRPVSKQNVRSIREEHSQRLAQTELLNRTRFPYLDFYRAHSSVNLPLSDLLPAVDRSMNNKSGKTKLNVYEHVPSITSDPPRGLEAKEVTKPELNPPTLGGPPFKENNKTPETSLKRQPSCIIDYYQNPSQWIRNQTAKMSDGSSQGVRLSGNPDKDSKKKLRDAFSRFYNTRSSMKNRDWAKDYKYMWNS